MTPNSTALLLLSSLTLSVIGCAATNPSPVAIIAFQGHYRFLSNFWPAEVVDDGIVYPSVEHAYQSAKTLDLDERHRIAQLPTPADAKREGESFPPRVDWPSIKYQTMLRCVRYKFTHHPELARQLLATGDAYLEEGNSWHDQIWGVYEGHGTNWLGKILMQVRDDLRHQI